MVEGRNGSQWLEITPQNYMYYVKDAGICNFYFRGIDAPFNIIGTPIYEDYYVSHFYPSNFTNNATLMSFTSNGLESGKPTPELVSEDFATEKTFNVKLATEDVEEADGIALIIGAVVIIGVITGITWYAIWGFTNDKFAVWVMILIIIGGLVVAVIVGIIIYFLAYAGLTPGENYHTVEDANVAITKVKASHVTIFGIVSFAAYKIFGGKKTEEKKTEALAEAVVEVEDNAN